MRVWIAGQVRDDGQHWQVVGVFSTEQLAVAAASDDRTFIGPLEVDVYLGDVAMPWPGGYYPTALAEVRGT